MSTLSAPVVVVAPQTLVSGVLAEPVAWTLPLCTTPLTRQQPHPAAGTAVATAWLSVWIYTRLQSDLYGSDRPLYSARLLWRVGGSLSVNSVHKVWPVLARKRISFDAHLRAQSARAFVKAQYRFVSSLTLKKCSFVCLVLFFWLNISSS